ncbi:MAG TPA: nickel-type superoxide dismutase maturation protease [Candidatus Limnocylindria bacterium]|nr:nickel-type superoxide dismutase maturation protease [Candidatus Limnocylindria bacterium]
MFRGVAVAGHSMEPALRDGDWVIVAPLWRPPRRGEIVLARDPRVPERLVLKRVARVEDGRYTLLGDRPDESTDSRTFGPVALSHVVGRAVFRYAPLARARLL